MVATTRRGFRSGNAAMSARGIAVEEVRRGEVRPTADTFGEFWAKLLETKRPYVVMGEFGGVQLRPLA